MRSDLPLTLHYLPTSDMPKPASILQISPMRHKANNTMLRGLRFKAFHAPGHTNTLPNVIRRLLGPLYAQFFYSTKNLLPSLQGISFWAPAGRPAVHALTPLSIPGSHAAGSCACPWGLMKWAWGGHGGQRRVVIFLFMFHLLFFLNSDLCLDKCLLTNANWHSTFYFLHFVIFTLTK